MLVLLVLLAILAQFYTQNITTYKYNTHYEYQTQSSEQADSWTFTNAHIQDFIFVTQCISSDSSVIYKSVLVIITVYIDVNASSDIFNNLRTDMTCHVSNTFQTL